MKRKYSIFTIGMFFICTAYAYNPISSGELLNQVSTPESLSGAASSAGGGLWRENPSQLYINPALLATEQRMVGTFSYTSIFNVSDQNPYGQSIFLGATIPSQFGVFSGNLQTILCGVNSTPYGNHLAIRAAYSKDVTEKLFFGMGLYGGFVSDWALGVDIGALYNIGSFSIFKDFRVAASLTGMGKNYIPSATGIDGLNPSTGIPSMFTFRTGVAATVVSLDSFQMGFSFDIGSPSFQNLVIDTGVQMEFANIVLNTGWQFNLRETLQHKASYIPSFGVSFKFGFATGEDSWMAKQGWRKSEIVTAVAYKTLNNMTHAISAGASMYLGLPDTEAPKIELWESDDEK